MPALSDYSNVHNTALLVLGQKGFQVWLDQASGLYCAEKDGWDFMSDSPTGLLGVVAIYEHKRPAGYEEYWWREREPFILDKLPKEPRPYRPER